MTHGLTQYAAVATSVLCSAASPASAQMTPVVNEDFKLIAPDPGEGFALNAAIDGEVAVCGAYIEDANGKFNSGAAYVYRFDGSSGWNLEQRLTASDGIVSGHFGASVSISGDVLVVGARRDDDNGPVSGSAYVYRFDGSSWNEERKLTASDGDALDLFGSAVSISGDVIVVGARLDDHNGLYAGSAYIFRFDGSSWNEEQKLLASDGGIADAFGDRVAAGENVVVIGAWLDDDKGGNAGAVYVYRFDGSSWYEEQKVTASDGATGDAFGRGLSISGDFVVVGAIGGDGLASSTGSAYVYRFDGASWNEEQKLFASDGARVDRFGIGVSIDGNVIVVSADWQQDNGFRSGAAYVYRFDGLAWNEDVKLLASDGSAGDWFGSGDAVMVDENTVLIGTEADAAYVFDLVEPVGNRPPAISCPVAESFQCDDSPPQASIILTADVADADGDELLVSWEVDGTTVLDQMVSGSGPPTQATVSLNHEVEGLGDHEITVTVDDGLALRSCALTITILDTAPPVAMCLSNVATTTDPGACFASAVDLPVPQVSDNCEVADSSNDAPATFPKGDTIVTWTFTDVGGNQASCTQTITVQDAEAPVVVTCPDEVVSSTDPGQCDAVVALQAPVATDNCDVPSLTNDAPSSFAIGPTMVTWIATDSSGNMSGCFQLVTVLDPEPPDAAMTVSPEHLWPANHDAVEITMEVVATDNCAVDSMMITVASNEPDNAHGGGDGHTTGDIVIMDANGDVKADSSDCGDANAQVLTSLLPGDRLSLRAERAGNGARDEDGEFIGRNYTITLSVTDGSGNLNSSIVVVNVPHDAAGHFVTCDDPACSGS